MAKINVNFAIKLLYRKIHEWEQTSNGEDEPFIYIRVFKKRSGVEIKKYNDNVRAKCKEDEEKRFKQLCDEGKMVDIDEVKVKVTKKIKKKKIKVTTIHDPVKFPFESVPLMSKTEVLETNVSYIEEEETLPCDVKINCDFDIIDEPTLPLHKQIVLDGKEIYYPVGSPVELSDVMNSISGIRNMNIEMRKQSWECKRMFDDIKIKCDEITGRINEVKGKLIKFLEMKMIPTTAEFKHMIDIIQPPNININEYGNEEIVAPVMINPQLEFIEYLDYDYSSSDLDSDLEFS